MKIKLAILEQDTNYLQRLVSTIEVRYAEKLEIYSYRDKDAALANLDKLRIDFFIADDTFDFTTDSIPKRCGFAYLVESSDISSVKGQMAICKFQNVEQIYKQILSGYAEIAPSDSRPYNHHNSSKVTIFSSPCGGVGNSSMAAACALYFASKGFRTVYLNLEKFGSSDIFFKCDGPFNMSDIVFAVKSKKDNIAMKLESSVKQDNRGVYFFSCSNVALDMLEMSQEDILNIILSLRSTDSYDQIVIDMDFSLDETSRCVFEQSDSIVMVGDGSEISNEKILRAYTAMKLLDETSNNNIFDRCVLIYNKFSNKSSTDVCINELRNIGGAPRFDHAGTQDVITQLSNLNFFDKING